MSSYGELPKQAQDPAPEPDEAGFEHVSVEFTHQVAVDVEIVGRERVRGPLVVMRMVGESAAADFRLHCPVSSDFALGVVLLLSLRLLRRNDAFRCPDDAFRSASA